MPQARQPGRVNLSQYAQVMGEVAAQHKAVFVDHCNAWRDGNARPGPPCPSSATDSTPYERGHHRIALKMIKDLRIFDADGRVCSLHIP